MRSEKENAQFPARIPRRRRTALEEIEAVRPGNSCRGVGMYSAKEKATDLDLHCEDVCLASVPARMN